MKPFKESGVKAIKVKRMKPKTEESMTNKDKNQVFKSNFENEQFYGVKYIDEEDVSLSNSHVKYIQESNDLNYSKDESLIHSMIFKISEKINNRECNSLEMIDEESTEVRSMNKEKTLSSNNNDTINKTSKSKHEQKDLIANEYRQTHRKSKSEMFSLNEHSWALNLLESHSKNDNNGVKFQQVSEDKGFFSRLFNPFQCNTRKNES